MKNLKTESYHKAIYDLLVANIVSKIAVAYGVMWLLLFWFQNIIYSTMISGFGVVLLIVVAIGMDNVFGENDESETKLKIELEKIKEEIAGLKNNGKTNSRIN